MTPGETYYIKVIPYSIATGGYSIRLSDSGYGGASTATPTDVDAYEPTDDTSGGATTLSIDVVSDHTITSTGDDVDWFVFTAP